MTDKEIEARIRLAAEHAAPDDLDRILARCTEQNQKSAADMPHLSGRGAPVFFRVILDVNPSVYLDVDDGERVLACMARNEEAAKCLEETDLTGLPLAEAVDAIVSRMTREGYLSETQNSILVSVQSGDAGAQEALQRKVSGLVEEAMEDSMRVSGEGIFILSQVVDEDDAELAELAGEYGISTGKAALIRKMTGENQTFADLAPLTVNDIALLAQERNWRDKTVTQIGHASDRAYIGHDGALLAAMEYSGVKAGKVKKRKVKLDTDKDRLAYKVSIKAKHGKYKYLLDARTGAVLACKEKNKHGKKYKYKYKGKKYSYKTKGKKYKGRSYDMSGKKKKNYYYYGTPGQPGAPGTAAGAPGAAPAAPIQVPEGAIGEEAARQAALAHAGVPAAQTQYVNCTPQIGHGPDHYDVKFVANGLKYKYAIGLYDGAVYGRAVKDKAHKGKYVYEGNYHEHFAPMGPGMTAPPAYAQSTPPVYGQASCAAPEAAAEPAPEGEDAPCPPPTQQAATDPTPQAAPNPTPGNGGMISEQEALAIAMDKAGLVPENLIRWKLKLRDKHGSLLYRYKLKVPGYEYEVDVDAYTGNVTKFHRELDY